MMSLKNVKCNVDLTKGYMYEAPSENQIHHSAVIDHQD